MQRCRISKDPGRRNTRKEKGRTEKKLCTPSMKKEEEEENRAKWQQG